MKILAILITTFVVLSESKRIDKSAFNFGSMLYTFIDRNPIAFIGYGNWCGLGPYGSNPDPVDELDTCCKNHDKCYEKTGCTGSQWAVVNHYSWDQNDNGEIVCKDSVGTCDRANCECDKTATLCFKNTPYNCNHASGIYYYFCK
ncbi:uncharacterized protein TRIADDRAFT_60284 [Trichoplax adhaerens]|uniref:Phospholipase A2-like central domain-containing protein n=1 Tax=Trichoplax adhaerens TaxID=10228 RepID=B3S7T3_TRIAD|nr:hypothetical protein TRIADDRAFT_60284 [Trichoplax adhaerens]EDV21347.1 hypothetical protein TRIADDRAFT_60284 [Trichoplax adhaerens]|eukprot:XP_002116314.1 hypothetical protein TRIADDRAFT_60284 [Trichoplax adhaerens]